MTDTLGTVSNGYIELPVDVNPQDLQESALAAIAADLPGWVPREGHIEVLLLEQADRGERDGCLAQPRIKEQRAARVLQQELDRGLLVVARREGHARLRRLLLRCHREPLLGSQAASARRGCGIAVGGRAPLAS